jgi:hypothetical protein
VTAPTCAGCQDPNALVSTACTYCGVARLCPEPLCRFYHSQDCEQWPRCRVCDRDLDAVPVTGSEHCKRCGGPVCVDCLYGDAHASLDAEEMECMRADMMLDAIRDGDVDAPCWWGR